MNLINAFKNELFRPFVILFIPGIIASTPYILLFMHCNYDVYEYLIKNEIIFSILIFSSAIAMGLIVENIGSRIEIFWDNKISKIESDFHEIWLKYLSFQFENEPIFCSYIRSILLRYKFELHLFVSIFISMVGQIILNYKIKFVGCNYLVIVLLIEILISIYSLRESFSSAHLMSNIRKEMVKRIKNNNINKNSRISSHNKA